MKRVFLFTIIFLTVITSRLTAQDTTHLAEKWTLRQCIDYARQHNIQLSNLRLSQQSSHEDLLQSKAARLPNVAGTASQYYTHAKNADPVIGGFQTQSSIASNYSLNSSWTLYQGGYIKNDIKEKDLLLQAANLNVLQSEMILPCKLRKPI